MLPNFSNRHIKSLDTTMYYNVLDLRFLVHHVVFT